MASDADRVDADRAAVSGWVADYAAAWRSEGTGALAELFAPGASYRMSSYAEPVRSLDAIGELWEREREGPGEEFQMGHQVVAVDGDTAVVRVDVAYGDGAEYRDLWILRFASDGRCREFEEWPFWPGQQIADDEGGLA